ncbi:LysR family transcriptional regulator [Mycobacterium sp. 360MFTsu5.1]|uniref:LysR substrate-binding domain-containing protein n=1 Tax=Mycobacterium sp. 360MFTsu5.1 TaxID=1172186 RepID=UPI0003818EF8|nr:LysR family transcriptional regulator [Mycobacterium sp. 360MFTsu5.1]
MLTTHIERADLNLLTPLVALLEERQVSRAASRVGLSQPAMSRALQRLRRLLDDPLLVRDPEGFRLSARAEDIHRQLATLIPLLENLLSPAEFDPRASTQPVNVAGSDYAVHTYGPAIARLIRSQSPDTAVRFRSWRPDGIEDQIRRGAVDLGLYGGHTPDDLNATQLITEQFKCVVSEGHPLATRGSVTLEDYLECSHVVVDVADGKQPDIDYRLAELGRARRAVVTVPYHTATLPMLHGTDLVATLPGRFIDAWIAGSELRLLPAPAEIATMPYRMIWHPAFELDRRHQWLRECVRRAVIDHE